MNEFLNRLLSGHSPKHDSLSCDLLKSIDFLIYSKQKTKITDTGSNANFDKTRRSDKSTSIYI